MFDSAAIYNHDNSPTTLNAISLSLIVTISIYRPDVIPVDQTTVSKHSKSL